MGRLLKLTGSAMTEFLRAHGYSANRPTPVKLSSPTRYHLVNTSSNG